MTFKSTLLPVPLRPRTATVSPALNVQTDTIQDRLIAKPLVQIIDHDRSASGCLSIHSPPQHQD